jgi:hypothetical protein
MQADSIILNRCATGIQTPLKDWELDFESQLETLPQYVHITGISIATVQIGESTEYIYVILGCSLLGPWENTMKQRRETIHFYVHLIIMLMEGTAKFSFNH